MTETLGRPYVYQAVKLPVTVTKRAGIVTTKIVDAVLTLKGYGCKHNATMHPNYDAKAVLVGQYVQARFGHKISAQTMDAVISEAALHGVVVIDQDKVITVGTLTSK